MNIELKNIKHAPSLSQETEAFTANIYINGKHAGYAENAGHGGETNYYPKDAKGKELIKQAEDFAKTRKQPDEPFLNMAFEEMINDLLYEHLQKKEIEKFNKKIDKVSEMAIVVGVPDHSFGYYNLKNPIANFLVTPERAEQLKNILMKSVIPQLKPNEKVLNKNIPEKILKDAGLKMDQYMEPNTILSHLNIPDKNIDQNNRRR